MCTIVYRHRHLYVKALLWDQVVYLYKSKVQPNLAGRDREEVNWAQIFTDCRRLNHFFRRKWMLYEILKFSDVNYKSS